MRGSSDDDTLAEWLHDRNVTAVDIVGIATDHCVRATAIDAAENGFDTTVLLDLTAGVARATTDKALRQMRQAGISLIGEPVVKPVQQRSISYWLIECDLVLTDAEEEQ